jgi:hypothetical protein
MGATTISALAIAPAFAAAATSQSSAQSINLTLAGRTLIAQKVTASNDGTTETRSDTSTIPKLLGSLPNNTALNASVLPQLARANADGTSYACAGLTSAGSDGIVTVGSQSCNLTGTGTLPLNLGHLALGDIVVNNGALATALGPILNPLGPPVNQVVTQIANALNGTPLGQIGLLGNLGVISAVCQANPDAASGNATLADSTIELTLPNVSPNITLVHLPVNPKENQKVVGDTPGSTKLITDALSAYLAAIIQGQFAGTPLAALPTTVQTEVLNQLLAGLKPLTDAIAQYLAEITLRETVHGDNGRSIDVTALHAEILPAVRDQLGTDLIEGRIGRVTCGPNTRATANPAGGGNNTNSPKHHPTPKVPSVVDSGLAGHQDHTARNVLGATGALMLLAGTAGLMGYRRMLNK